MSEPNGLESSIDMTLHLTTIPEDVGGDDTEVNVRGAKENGKGISVDAATTECTEEGDIT